MEIRGWSLRTHKVPSERSPRWDQGSRTCLYFLSTAEDLVAQHREDGLYRCVGNPILKVFNLGPQSHLRVFRFFFFFRTKSEEVKLCRVEITRGFLDTTVSSRLSCFVTRPEGTSRDTDTTTSTQPL